MVRMSGSSRRCRRRIALRRLLRFTTMGIGIVRCFSSRQTGCLEHDTIRLGLVKPMTLSSMTALPPLVLDFSWHFAPPWIARPRVPFTGIALQLVQTMIVSSVSCYKFHVHTFQRAVE
jgi:hypothetical protein